MSSCSTDFSLNLRRESMLLDDQRIGRFNMLKVRVECYAGTRSEESPRRIHFNGRTHVVARLVAETFEESPATRQRQRRYKILTEEGLVIEIARARDGWYLLSSEFNL